MKVDISMLDRGTLERWLQIRDGQLKAVVRAVEENTEPGWKVRRAVDEVLVRYNGRVEFVRNAAEGQIALEAKANANELRWRRIGASSS